MRVAVDAMGGDNAPAAIVEGAIAAAEKTSGGILLVGDPDAIKMHSGGKTPPNLEIVPATQVIGMDEKPGEAIRRKRDSSMVVAADLVRSGEAGGIFSAGNTGAATGAALLAWRTVEGVHRPVIAATFPRRGGRFLLVDAGANVDAHPDHIVEFAVIGRAYANLIHGKKNPTVHLLNIGSEAGKGDNFTKQAYERLKDRPWFEGNIESNHAFEEPVDVVVCDGFAGNVLLKCAEGVGEYVIDMIKSEVPSGPARILYLPLKRLMRGLKRKMDYAEYGGSPLLGLNGVCVIGHGRSNAKAADNGTRLAMQQIETGLVEAVREQLRSERQKE